MKVRLLVAIGLAVGLTLGVWAALASQSAEAQAVCKRFVVSPGGSDTGNCASNAAPCRTIQYALSKAALGDRICVADRTDLPYSLWPSVYTGTVSINKNVILDGGWTAFPMSGHWHFQAGACPSQNVVIDA